MRQLGPFGGVAVAALFAAMALLVWIVMRRRVERAQAGERLADERRDRFLAVAARELDAPLSTLRADLAALDPWSATPPRIAELTRELDGVRRLVTELARLPAPVDEAERIDVDLAELVREVIGGPPFSDRGHRRARAVVGGAA
jgi:signal transduction histidine kinase